MVRRTFIRTALTGAAIIALLGGDPIPTTQAAAPQVEAAVPQVPAESIALTAGNLELVSSTAELVPARAKAKKRRKVRRRRRRVVRRRHSNNGSRAPGSINGYPCGGNLPPCFVLQRESRGDPRAENPTSTASGLWQFLDSTWAGYAGVRHASYASVASQNQRAVQLWAGGKGCSHWAAC